VQDNGALIHGLIEKRNLMVVFIYKSLAQTQGLNGKQPSNMAGLKKVAVSLFQMPMLHLRMTMWLSARLNMLLV
jgi:hypothetical protein